MNTAAATIQHQDSPNCVSEENESAFLHWFAASGAPMSEKTLRLGGLEYHQFSSFFPAQDGRICGAYGRSQSRRIAALKCAAEFVERKTMLDYFQNDPAGQSVPRPLRTSNGWAVHFQRSEAEHRAYLECLERHLLLKSFLQFGWEGFRFFQKIESPDLDLYLLTSRFCAGSYVSGLVAAKSSLYTGVSFGYCVGRTDQLSGADFWEPALFEAVDKILTLSGEKIDLTQDPRSWLRSETKAYLETQFDIGLLSEGRSSPLIKEGFPEADIVAIDLTQKFALSFSLWAAFASGKGLIPIFHKSALDTQAEAYLRSRLTKNGLASELPERHPIL